MATIKKRKNSYIITASCGYDNSGKQIRHTMTWKPTPGMTAKQEEKEINRQALLFDERCRNGQYVNGSIKLSDFIELWQKDYAAKQLRPKTIEFYNRMIKRILPALGHLSLDKIRPHHLMAFYDNLQEAGTRDDNKYKSTVDFKELLKARTQACDVGSYSVWSGQTWTLIKALSMSTAKAFMFRVREYIRRTAKPLRPSVPSRWPRRL